MNESAELIELLVTLIVDGVMQLGSNVLGIAAYVIGALSLYTIAKRRGIDKPWLAWVPVANAWILGSISDQYQQLMKNKETTRRKTLLILNIAVAAVGTLTVILCAVLGVVLFFNPTAVTAWSIALGALLCLLLVLMVGISIAQSIFIYISYYDLFLSCDPDKAVLFLVLSIIVPYAQPVVAFICRNKDDGMMVPCALPEEIAPEAEN